MSPKKKTLPFCGRVEVSKELDVIDHICAAPCRPVWVKTSEWLTNLTACLPAMTHSVRCRSTAQVLAVSLGWFAAKSHMQGSSHLSTHRNGRAPCCFHHCPLRKSPPCNVTWAQLSSWRANPASAWNSKHGTSGQEFLKQDVGWYDFMGLAPCFRPWKEIPKESSI